MSPRELAHHESVHYEYVQPQTTVSTRPPKHGYRCRNVDEKERDLNDLTQTDCPIGSFGFDNGRTRGVMVVWFCHTPLFELFGHPFNHFAILGVNHGREIVFPSCQHNVQKFTITKFKSFVCHVQFA